MRRPGNPWVAAAVSALLVAAAGAVAFRSQDPECVRAEVPRPLDLTVAEDRAHLEADRADVQVLAAAFSAAVARRPMLSDSIDAAEGARTAPVRAQAWCKAMLEAELAATHNLTVEQVRGTSPAGSINAGGQADAARTTGAASMSSVVSRPLR